MPALRQGRAFQFIQTFDAVVLLLNMTKSANVGAVVDLWQMQVSGNPLDEARKLPAERIVAVYVSGGPTTTPASAWTAEQRLLPGEGGAIDLAAALAALAEHGYDGPVTPCADRASVAGKSREQIVKLASDAIDQAWQAAGLSPSGKLLAAGSR